MAWWIQNIKSQGKIFLNLLNNDLSDIEPSYMKGGPWIESFGFSNSLCAQTTQAITNHAPIGEYWLCFFPREEFSCPCGLYLYPIETRQHVLYNCKRFNKGWNPGREKLFQFISFLEYNPNAFSFGESITWACNSFAAIALYIFFSFSFSLVLFNVVTK